MIISHDRLCAKMLCAMIFYYYNQNQWALRLNILEEHVVSFMDSHQIYANTLSLTQNCGFSINSQS